MNRRIFVINCNGQRFGITANQAVNDKVVEERIRGFVTTGLPIHLTKGNLLEILIDGFFDIAVVGEIHEIDLRPSV